MVCLTVQAGFFLNTSIHIWLSPHFLGASTTLPLSFFATCNVPSVHGISYHSILCQTAGPLLTSSPISLIRASSSPINETCTPVAIEQKSETFPNQKKCPSLSTDLDKASGKIRIESRSSSPSRAIQSSTERSSSPPYR